MRKIINSTYLSLDGVQENPQNWSLGYFNDEAGVYASEQLFASDTLLMGRRTYDAFAASWPTRSGNAFTDRINSMTKLVASSTLRNPTWNNTHAIRGDLVTEVTKLKEGPGENILIYGFGPVSHALMAQGLIDEIRFWIHPVFVGGTGPADLLFRQCPQTKLELVSTKALKTGVVINAYKPVSV